MLLISLLETVKEIPSGVKLFAKRAMVLFCTWLLIYYPILQPMRLPDKWLTAITANATTVLLNNVLSGGFKVRGNSASVFSGKNKGSAEIQKNNSTVISIADSCNALKLYVIYIGFIVCMPFGFKRMTAFALGGVLAIYLLNISRCFALAWLWLNQPGWVDFAHHYVFTLLVYSCIFALWVWYGRNKRISHEKAL